MGADSGVDQQLLYPGRTVVLAPLALLGPLLLMMVGGRMVWWIGGILSWFTTSQRHDRLLIGSVCL